MSAAVIPIHPPVPLPPAVPASPLLHWVELYAAAGLPPIAIRPADKMPLAKGWQSATLEEARALLQANPGANLGIAVPPGYVVLDVDKKGAVDGYATLRAFELEHGPLPPTLRAKTPSGGAHYWFTVPEGMPVPNATGFALGLDTRSAGKGLVVVEPSVTAAGAYRWENWGTDIAPAPERLLQAMRSKKSVVHATPGEPLRFPAGVRNDELARRAINLRKLGFTDEEIHSAIAALNRRACVIPVDDQELRMIVTSAAKYDRDALPHEVFAGPAPLPPGALAEKPRGDEWERVSLNVSGDVFEPLPHVVDRWIPLNEVTLLTGHGGGGKSYVALSIAVHVALGLPFGPLATKRGRVLFYSAEDPARVLRSRLARICRTMSITLGELADSLIPLDASDIDPALFRKNHPLPLLDRLAAAAKEHAATLVIIDNASDAFDGDEIKRAEVRGFIRALRTALARPGRSVLLLAHVNKLSAQRGRRSGDSEASEDYSGSTAWHNSARSRLSLTPQIHDTLLIEHAKANLGPKADPVRLEWRDGVPVFLGTTAVDHEARAAMRRERMHAVGDTIARIERRGSYVPAARSGPRTVIQVLSEDEAFPRGLDKVDVFHILDEMQAAGIIHRKVIRTKGRKDVEAYSCHP